MTATASASPSASSAECKAALRLKRGKTDERLPARTVLWLAVSGAVMGINWILLFEAYNRTTGGGATLCYYMEPTIVTLLVSAAVLVASLVFLISVMN